MTTLANQRVLVTGATGFLGSHIWRRLSQLGADVLALSRRAVARTGDAAHWVQGDLTDIGTVRRLLKTERPDVIFQLSTFGTAAPGLAQVLPTFHADLQATVNVLAAATEIGCGRIVHVASLEEPLGGPEDGVPASPYAAAKWASGMYARMFRVRYGTPVVLARVYMAYGPRQREYKLIPYVTQSLLRGEAPKLTSGERPVDFVYVADVVDGLLAAAQVGDGDEECLEFGSGNLVTIRSVVERLVQLTDAKVTPQFGLLPDRHGETVRVADTSAAQRRLGWKATTSLQDGLAQTVEWYRQRLAPTARATGDRR